MFRFLSRVPSAAAALLGLTGILLSVFAVQRIWVSAARASEDLPRAVGQLESVTESVQRQGVTAAELLDQSRLHLAGIRGTVDELSLEGQGRNLSSILEDFDADLLSRLEQAEIFIRDMRSSMDGASGALALLDSLPLFGRGIGDPARRQSGELQVLASSLNELSGLLDQITQTLVEIRTRGTVQPQQVAVLTQGIDRLDGALDNTLTDVKSFNAEIDTLSKRLTATRLRTPRLIRQLAVFLTIFFVCFAASQLNLLSRGIDGLIRGRQRRERPGDAAPYSGSG